MWVFWIALLIGYSTEGFIIESLSEIELQDPDHEELVDGQTNEDGSSYGTSRYHYDVSVDNRNGNGKQQLETDKTSGQTVQEHVTNGNGTRVDSRQYGTSRHHFAITVSDGVDPGNSRQNQNKDSQTITEENNKPYSGTSRYHHMIPVSTHNGPVHSRQNSNTDSPYRNPKQQVGVSDVHVPLTNEDSKHYGTSRYHHGVRLSDENFNWRRRRRYKTTPEVPLHNRTENKPQSGSSRYHHVISVSTGNMTVNCTQHSECNKTESVKIASIPVTASHQTTRVYQYGSTRYHHKVKVINDKTRDRSAIKNHQISGGTLGLRSTTIRPHSVSDINLIRVLSTQTIQDITPTKLKHKHHSEHHRHVNTHKHRHKHKHRHANSSKTSSNKNNNQDDDHHVYIKQGYTDDNKSTHTKDLDSFKSDGSLFVVNFYMLIWCFILPNSM